MSQSRVLIVDDEPNVVYTLRCILEHFGYSASEAGSVEEALAVLKSQRIQAMICDLALKGSLSGVDVIAKARAEQPDIACILLTGYAEPEILDSLENQGIPVLFKPIEMGRLLSQLRQMTEKKAA
jgi:DNA-binding NtrC family response regulator